MRNTLIVFLLFFATTAVAQQKDSVKIKPLNLDTKTTQYQKLKWVNFETGVDITWLIPTIYVGTQIKLLNTLAFEASYGFLYIPWVLPSSKKIGLVKYFYPKSNTAFFIKTSLEQLKIAGKKTPFFPKLSIGVNANHFNISAGIGGYSNLTHNKYYQHGNQMYFIFPSLNVGFSNFLFNQKNNFK